MKLDESIELKNKQITESHYNFISIAKISPERLLNIGQYGESEIKYFEDVINLLTLRYEEIREKIGMYSLDELVTLLDKLVRPDQLWPMLSKANKAGLLPVKVANSLFDKIPKKTKQMENMSNQRMRSIMEEMALDEAMKNCMHEVLMMEGFLPETLSEGETYDEFMSTMMEDDEIMAEMYKACSMNESDCGSKMNSWLNEKLTGGQKKLDKNNNGEIDSTDFTMLRKEKGVDEMELNEYEKAVMSKFQDQYGKKRGKEVYYATANKQGRSPETFKKNEGEMYEGDYSEGEHYKVKISQICDDLADVNRMMSDNDELPAWIQDKLSVMYHSADAIKTYLSGENSSGMNESEDDEDEENSDSPTYMLKKKKVLDQEIFRYSKFVDKFIPMVDKLDISDLITYFQPQGDISLEGFKDFLTKKEEESPVDYYEKLNQTGDFNYRVIFDGLVNPRKRGFFTKYGKKISLDTIDDMEDVLSDVFDIGNSIYVKKKEIEKIEDSMSNREEKGLEYNDSELGDMLDKPKATSKPNSVRVSADDEFDDEDDDMLEEITLPIKGKNVDSENKSNANKENSEATKDAEDSQETTEEKVDNLKNQKHELNNWEQSVDEILHGWRNNLDLDYKTGLDKDQAKKIKDQVSGVVPKDHANVDHESEAGQKLIDSAKKRSNDKFINNDDYTSKHDRTRIEKGETYEKTTVFDELNEGVDEDIKRLKALFSYEDKLVTENKKHVVNEDELFFKQVSTKKFI